ncbi:hypothetical protein J6590_001011 [Homalodisca vitripennis]|nr:hypothetical protein J6590_001011 [Homalodisca vitripennis]
MNAAHLSCKSREIHVRFPGGQRAGSLVLDEPFHRDFRNTSHQEGVEHIHDVTVALDMNGRDQLLDLRLNRELIPKGYFEKHQKDGSYVIRRPGEKEVELCHYQGKLRGVLDSWAAISTCNGLRGVVYDGHELHYLERATNSTRIHDVDHYLYSHSNLVSNFTCGFEGTDQKHISDFHKNHRISKRFKRSDEMIRGPYNANASSSYVELVLVLDNKEYKALGENMNNVNSHCKDIANIINALYVPLNIFIALVGVVVWTEYDEINLSSNGDTTLTNFLHYRRERLVKEHPNDNAQLLTRMQFEGGVVGKALKGPICTFEFSGGVSMDHSSVVGLVATTVAHEMGHNFGMEHDSSDCQCPDERCIMAPSSSSMSPTHWSVCSLEYLALAFEHGMDYCLRNKPTKLFDSPVCGNGFVEVGEQCDCGLKDHCDNPCCNANTCMLFSNASCATGECCDLKRLSLLEHLVIESHTIHIIDLFCFDKIYYGGPRTMMNGEKLSANCEVVQSFRDKLLTLLDNEISNLSGDQIFNFDETDKVHYVTQSWEGVGADFAPRKEEDCPYGENVQKETETDNTTLLPLFQQVPGCANATEKNMNEWITQDKQYEVADEEIVNMANRK